MFNVIEKVINFIGVFNVNMACDFIYYQDEEPKSLEKYRL